MLHDMKKIFFKNNDLIVGIIFLIFGAALLQQTLLITVDRSRIFPFVAIGIILISGIALLINGFIKTVPNNTEVFKLAKKELITLVILLITYFAIRVLGFYTSIYLFLMVCYLYIEGTWSKSAVITAFIFNSILIVILYVSFTMLLGMTMPTGLFL